MLDKKKRKQIEAFRKAKSADETLRLTDTVRQERNHILGAPEKDGGLAFVEAYFEKEIEKPHLELGAITETWLALAPDYAKAAAQLVSFKRGTLEMAVPSAAVKYKLDMDLRTGLEQRLRAAHPGETLKKVKVAVGSGTASATTAGDSELEGLRRVKLSEVMKAAEEGEL